MPGSCTPVYLPLQPRDHRAPPCNPLPRHIRGSGGQRRGPCRIFRSGLAIQPPWSGALRDCRGSRRGPNRSQPGRQRRGKWRRTRSGRRSQGPHHLPSMSTTSSPVRQTGEGVVSLVQEMDEGQASADHHGGGLGAHLGMGTGDIRGQSGILLLGHSFVLDRVQK